VAANSHYLESWADTTPKKGYYTITQPTIRNLFDTRQFEECLMKWSGIEGSYHDFIQENWRTNVLQGASWNKAVQDGLFQTEISARSRQTAIASEFLAAAQRQLASASSAGLELVLYAKTGMGDGQMANNPWLQEFPDPISRASWDNYLTISKADAESYGLQNGTLLMVV
jgi:quinol:cytochrome c oxidoreductase iron-sulfur protein precursor